MQVSSTRTMDGRPSNSWALWLGVVLALMTFSGAARASAQPLDPLGNPTFEPLGRGEVGIVSPPPRPRPAWNFGLALGHASLGALAGMSIGGLVGLGIGLGAQRELGDGGVPIAAGMATGIGLSLGVPLVLALVNLARPSGGEPWWALLGSAVTVAVGFGVGLLVGVIAPDGSQGITPALITGGVLGASLSPIGGAIAFWLSQPRAQPR